MKKKTSIHDIAKELGISATTVSFIINGKAAEMKISSALEKKVRDYILLIGYQPNHLAQSLRTGKTRMIGMLVEDISDPFFSTITRIVEENLYKLGYKIFHSSTDNNTERSRALIQIFRERQVDGYIIAPSPGIQQEIKELLKDDKPVILFDRFFPEIETTNVVIDNIGGAYNATIHLVNNGYRHIAFITLDSEQIQMMDRLKGYEKAVKESLISSCIQKLEYSTYKANQNLLAHLIKLFLEDNNSIDAVLFATNYLAISGLQAIKALGLRIPADVGVVGFDDNTHFSLFAPTITAVAQPINAISELAVQQLIKALATGSEKWKNKTTVLDTELKVRESSARRPVIGIEDKK